MALLAPSIALWLAAGAAPVPDADAALARPLSPGAVALLLEHVRDPRTATRLGEALRDPAPATRAAAARVANVAGIAALAPLLADVLAKEAESEAALEELDALITLDPQEDEAALAAARRLGGNAPERLALSLAGVRGPAALQKVELLRSLKLGVRTWERFLERAIRGAPQGVAPAAAVALRERDGELWTALSTGDTQGWARLEVPDLVASLDREDDLRAATLESLVLSAKAGVPRPGPLGAALTKLLEAGTPDGGSATLELLARLEGRPRHDLTARLLSVQDRDRAFWHAVAQRNELRALFDGKELEALRGALRLAEGKEWPAPFPQDPPEPLTPIYTIGGFPRGFVEDTLAQSGCSPDFSRDLGGIVRRGADGRPREASAFQDLAGGPECLRATSVLLASHLNRRFYAPAPGREEYLLLPLNPGSLSCAAPSDPGPAREDFPTGGRIQEPRKVRNLNPRYPATAKQKRVQGTVVIESVVSETGCVRDLHVVRGVYLPLDLEALRTVARWVYSPTLLGGVPVATVMTVTINFKLN